jgi:hypothetical protein
MAGSTVDVVAANQPPYQHKKQDRGLSAWRAGANAAWLLPLLGFVLVGAIITAIMNAVIGPLLITGCGLPKAGHRGRPGIPSFGLRAERPAT